MMLDSDIMEEAWSKIIIDFPFFSERYKVVILREMGYALKKAREDERQRIRERIEEWADDYAVDWGGIFLVRVDFLMRELEEDSKYGERSRLRSITPPRFAKAFFEANR